MNIFERHTPVEPLQPEFFQINHIDVLCLNAVLKAVCERPEMYEAAEAARLLRILEGQNGTG